jgi:hypothetical protein
LPVPAQPPRRRRSPLPASGSRYGHCCGSAGCSLHGWTAHV